MLGLQIEHDTKDSTRILLVPVRHAQAGNVYCLYLQRSFYIDLRDLNATFAQLNSTPFFNIAQRLIDETIQQFDIRKIERYDPFYIIAATMVCSRTSDTICLLSWNDCRRVNESVVGAYSDQTKIYRAIHAVAQMMDERSSIVSSPSASLDEPAYPHKTIIVKDGFTESTEAV